MLTVKKFITSMAAALVGMAAFAQQSDPVIMTINGKPVTRAEFEYSYNKNSDIEGAVEKKTVAEYADMFLNYKLKVAAAEAAQLDTLSSFKKEFTQYRDMQLMPSLIDTAYIDSVARASYKQTQDVLKGQDMLRLAHILLYVPQGASAEADKAAKNRADSLYAVLKAGGDFADLAQRFSGDQGTARRGGELPWIGPGMTLADFEKAAYELHTVGELSAPVHSTVGYHIIKLLERKQLEPYDTLRPQILAALKRQGIEDASAEAKLKRIVAESNGRLTREAVMDSLLQAREAEDPNLQYLVREYHDGLLLYEVSKRDVWDATAKDSVGLESYFKAHKKQYTWTEPRFKGFVIHAKSEKALKQAQKVLKKYGNKDWKQAVKTQLNKDSVTVRVSGPYLSKQGENSIIDNCVFGADKQVKTSGAFTVWGVQGKKLSQPKSYTDVKAAVEADLQKEREAEWVEGLRKRFPYTINQDVLATVKER